jgi:hypothetical protein
LLLDDGASGNCPSRRSYQNPAFKVVEGWPTNLPKL